MALVLDTGVLVAALDRKQRAHVECRAVIEESDEQLVVPEPILVELDYLLRKMGSPQTWLSFCEDVDAGAFLIHHLDPAQLLETARLQTKFADLDVGYVDAAVVVVCAFLGEDKVATLDRRHFGVLRTPEGRALRVVP